MFTQAKIAELEAQTGKTFQPYTLKELEAKYGKMGALVIWQMRQQS